MCELENTSKSPVLKNIPHPAAGESDCSCFEGVPIRPLNVARGIREVSDDRFNHSDEMFPFESSINKGEEGKTYIYTIKEAAHSRKKPLSAFDSGSRGLCVRLGASGNRI